MAYRYLKRIKNTLIYLAIRLTWAVVARLPYRCALTCGRLVGILAFYIARGERQRSLIQIERALPDRTDHKTIVRQVFVHLGQSAAEVVALSRRPHRITQLVKLPDESRFCLENALRRGNGVVWITGHLGNWELMAMAMAYFGYPINTFAKRSYDPRITKLIRQTREHAGVHTILVDSPQRDSKIDEILARGQILGVLIDLDTKLSQALFVPFFHRPAYTSTGPLKLARKYNADVVIGTIKRTGRTTHQITICALPSDGSEAEVMGRWNRLLQEEISRRPQEWIWMHPRWKTQPSSEKNPL